MNNGHWIIAAFRHRMLLIRLFATVVIAVLGLHAVSLLADEPKVKIETLVSGLSEPCGVAIQPSTEDVFISDNGAGRIVKYSRLKPDQAVPVVVGFAHEEAPGKDATSRLGVLGLAFLNEHTLVAGCSAKVGDRAVLTYTLPAANADAEAKPIAVDAARQRLGAASEGDEAVIAEGKFFGLAVSAFAPPTLFVTNTGSSRGWIFKSEIKNWSTLETLNPFMFIPQKYIAQFGLPSGGITISRRGLLVVGMKNTDAAKGSSLVFFSGKTGGLLSGQPTTLHDIVGLAYSPESGRLYAADFSGADPQSAGVYRLDSAMVDGRSGIKAVKIAAIERPSALAFASDNTMYVTVFGPVEKESKKGQVPKSGKLVKITGDL
jgi:hypothetical protein